MKTSLLNSLICASLLAFAVGCGKDNSSSSKGTSQSGVNTLINNSASLSQQSQQALKDLDAWDKGTKEGTAITGTKVNISRLKFISSSANSNCSTNNISGGTLGDILDFVGFNEYQICTGSSSSNQQGETVFTKNGVNLRTGNTTAINKKSNTELTKLMSGGYGKVIQAAASGSTIQLTIVKADKVSTITFLVDKNYHSQLNPVVKVESSNAQGAPSQVIETRTFWNITQF